MTHSQVAKLKKDPLVDLGAIRLRMGVTFLESWTEIALRQSEIKLPLYVAYSAVDQVPHHHVCEKLCRLQWHAKAAA